jgi:hypothetical protein
MRWPLSARRTCPSCGGEKWERNPTCRRCASRWTEIAARRAAGESGIALAAEYGIKPNTLYRYVCRRNLPRAPRFGRGYPKSLPESVATIVPRAMATYPRKAS